MLKMVEKFKADAVERLSAELEKLNGQAAAALAEIKRLAWQEDEAENSEEVLAAMAATRGARNRLKKLEAKIADVRERLGIAKDASRAKLRADRLAPIAPAGRDFLASARATQKALDHYIATREALRTAGFERDSQSFPIPPHINGAAVTSLEMLAIFEDALNPAPRNTTASPPQAKVPEPKRGHVVPGPARLMRPDELRRPNDKRNRELRSEDAKEGELRVLLLRPGIELPDGTPSRIGDVVSLPERTATQLMLNGGADLAPTPELAPPNIDQAPMPEAAE